MDERLNGVFGVLRLLEERKAVVEAEIVELRTRLGFLEVELGTLRPAVRELGKSILPMQEEVKDVGG